MRTVWELLCAQSAPRRYIQPSCHPAITLFLLPTSGQMNPIEQFELHSTTRRVAWIDLGVGARGWSALSYDSTLLASAALNRHCSTYRSVMNLNASDDVSSCWGWHSPSDGGATMSKPRALLCQRRTLFSCSILACSMSDWHCHSSAFLGDPHLCSRAA